MSIYTFTNPSDPRVKLVGNKGATNALQAATGAVVPRVLRFFNLSAARVYMQVHNAASAPDEGTAPDMIAQPVDPGSALEYSTGSAYQLGVGLYVCASTTAATKTLAAASAAMIEAELTTIPPTATQGS